MGQLVNAVWSFSMAPTQPKWGRKWKVDSISRSLPAQAGLLEMTSISSAAKGTKFGSLAEAVVQETQFLPVESYDRGCNAIDGDRMGARQDQATGFRIR